MPDIAVFAVRICRAPRGARGLKCVDNDRIDQLENLCPSRGTRLKLPILRITQS